MLVVLLEVVLVNRHRVGAAVVAVASLSLGMAQTGAFAATTPLPISIVLTERPSPVPAGGTAVYVITLRNSGPAAVSALSVIVQIRTQVNSDGPGTMPAQVLTQGAGCVGAAGSQVCDVGTLGAGQTRTYQFSVRAAPFPGSVQGFAAFRQEPSGALSGDTGTLITPVVAVITRRPTPARAPVAVRGTPHFTG